MTTSLSWKRGPAALSRRARPLTSSPRAAAPRRPLPPLRASHGSGGDEGKSGLQLFESVAKRATAALASEFASNDDSSYHRLESW